MYQLRSFVAGSLRPADANVAFGRRRRPGQLQGRRVERRAQVGRRGWHDRGWGVLIFNGEHPTLADGKIVLQGGGSDFSLYPLDQGTYWDGTVYWNGMVIFQDRDISLDVSIVAGSSTMAVRGVIYAPGAHVITQSKTGTLTVDQAIASTFRIAGNGGTINVVYDAGFLPTLKIAGLVE